VDGDIRLSPQCFEGFKLSYYSVDYSLATKVMTVIVMVIHLVVMALWFYMVYYHPKPDPHSSGSSSSDSGNNHHHPTPPLPRVVERDWLSILLVGIFCYQNPIYTFGQWAPNIPIPVTFVSTVIAALGEVRGVVQRSGGGGDGLNSSSQYQLYHIKKDLSYLVCHLIDSLPPPSLPPSLPSPSSPHHGIITGDLPGSVIAVCGWLT